MNELENLGPSVVDTWMRPPSSQGIELAGQHSEEKDGRTSEPAAIKPGLPNALEDIFWRGHPEYDSPLAG